MSIRSDDLPPPPPRRPRKPAVNLPPVVRALIVVNVAVYAIGAVMPWRWTAEVLFSLGFIPARYDLPGALGWQALVSPITHQFLHGGTLHILVNMIMLAAFGTGVERAIGGRRMLALYLLSGIAGAALHYAFYPGTTVPVVGASGAISGLFGAVLRLMAKHSRATGGAGRILPVAAIWIAIAVITGFTGTPGTGGDVQVAWAAHVGGFLLGFAAFDLFALGVQLRLGGAPRRPSHLRDLDDDER